MSVIQNNTISTNSITEATSANGVSIDGLKVKDYSLMYGSNIGLTFSSDGYVTKPNVPAISVTMEINSADLDASTGAKNIFASGSYSSATALDTSLTGISQGITLGGSTAAPNGTFTVPVSGCYSISFFSIGAYNANTEYEIRINDTSKVTLFATTNGEDKWQNISGTFLQNMSASDTIKIFQAQSSEGNHYHGRRYSRATIYLIG